MNKKILDVLKELGFEYDENDNKVDLEVRNEGGFTPLMVAAIRKNSYAIKVLLEHGANINAEDKDGMTALMYAARYNSANEIGILLKFRARTYIGNGKSACMFAVLYNSKDVIKELLANMPSIDTEDKYNQTALSMALEGNRVFAIRTLLEHGADIEAKPLICAAFNNSVETITKLLENDVDIDAKDCYGYTALMWAAQNNSVDAIRVLLEHGVDTEAKNLDGRTALLLATENCSLNVIKLLLEHGADIESKDKYVPCFYISTMFK